jgi:hypothetical protein
VQLRQKDNGPRWRRSIYLTPVPQTFEIPAGEFRGVAHNAPIDAALASIDAVLFVVDTLNNRPGDRATVSIHNLQITTNK